MTYPWGSTSADSITIYPSQWTYNYDQGSYNTTWKGTWYGQSPIPAKVESVVEKMEDAMDWLRRRVTEITDLAYAEV